MAGGAVTVRVPASTANLGPGFDSLGLALTLYNTAALALRADAEVRLTVEGEGRGRLDREGKASLLARAAYAAFRHLGAEPFGLDIALHNQIPLRRGLGSSGTAILSGITGAAALLGRTLTADEVLRLALPFEGHPDNLVPSLLGGLVASGLADGRVLAVRVPLGAPLRAVAVIPDRELPTAEARRVLPRQVPREDAVFNVTRTALLVAALATGQYACLPHAPAQQFADAAAALDQRPRADDHRAHGRAQPLAQAKLHGVEFFRHLGDVLTKINGSIENPRTV